MLTEETKDQLGYRSWPHVRLSYLTGSGSKSQLRKAARDWLCVKRVTFHTHPDDNGTHYNLYIQDPKHMVMFKLKFGATCD